MRRWIGVAITLFALVGAGQADAQRLVSIGLGGGVSVPRGELGDGAGTGWNALVSLVVSAPMQPLGLRADVAYNQFPFDAANPGGLGSNGHESVGSGTINVTYRLPTPGSPVSPYLIAGLGAYRSDCSISAACTADTRFGWNAGLGTKLYVFGLRSFLEVRYHRTKVADASVGYFPVTLGLLF